MQGQFAFDPRMSVPGVDSFSPSAGKPAKFMELMLERYRFNAMHGGVLVEPATRADLCLVHNQDYVEAVFTGTTNNGFDNTDPRVPESCLWTAGGMTSAAHVAAEHRSLVCCPVSGFHHAGYNWGGGYCTFNGLMVAAAKMIESRPGARVGILDCDVHYGNGTDNILKNIPRLAKQVMHHTSGQHFHDDADPDEFFLWLQESINDLNSFGCDVVLYQAGADMHRDDPLGGFLDGDQMRQRDRMVFRKLRSGVVWNLAGGYRSGGASGCDPVLQTHLATAQEANASDVARRTLLAQQPKQQT